MKKSGLFKVLLAVLFVVVIASWFISASMFDPQTGSVMSLTDIFTQYYGLDLKSIQIGFFDIFKLIFATLMYFGEKLIFILSVGAFYGVLAKTGKYRAWIDKLAEKFKGMETTVVIAISIILILISSFTNLGILLFMFIPMLVGLVIALGYDKTTAFISTFGAVILGEFGSTFGHNISASINGALGTVLKTGIGYRLILLAFGIAFLIIFIIKSKRNKNDAKELDSFIGEKSSNKYSVVPLFVVFGILFVLLILGCTVWSDIFKTNVFETMHNNIMATKIGKAEVFKNITGIYYNLFFSSNSTVTPSLGALGTWGLQEMSIIILLASLLVGRLYRMKHSEVLNSMIDGAKKLLAPALLVLFAHTILIASQYYYPTVGDAILKLTSKFNVLTSSLTMALGSLFNMDVSYIASNVIPQIMTKGGNTTIIMLMSQGIYGIISLMAPTSIMLILGLSYLNLPYGEYIKKCWKYILILLAILIAFLLILSFVL